MTNLDKLHQNLRARAPALTAAVFDRLSVSLIGDLPGDTHQFVADDQAAAKDIGDPIWQIISLTRRQVHILNLPLMQRLRRVRQLGLAYLVYPGAQHSRLEHSIGAKHAAMTMFDHLARGQSMHRAAGEPSERDNLADLIAIAALLHDCGHTAFSHLGERVLADMFRDEFNEALRVFYDNFPDPIALDNSPGTNVSNFSGPKPHLPASSYPHCSSFRQR